MAFAEMLGRRKKKVKKTDIHLTGPGRRGKKKRCLAGFPTRTRGKKMTVSAAKKKRGGGSAALQAENGLTKKKRRVSTSSFLERKVAYSRPPGKNKQ